MDRDVQESYFLPNEGYRDISEEANCEESKPAPDGSTGESLQGVQTVYAALTPATIQDETGSIRQLYITVEQHPESLSLREISDNPQSGTLDQQLVAQGAALGSQLVTVALPMGQGGVQQLAVMDDGCLMIQPSQVNEGSVSGLLSSEQNQDNAATAPSGVHRIVMSNSTLGHNLSQIAAAMKQAGIPLQAIPQGATLVTAKPTLTQAETGSDMTAGEEAQLEATAEEDLESERQHQLDIEQSKLTEQQEKIQEHLKQKIQEQQAQIQRQQKGQSLSALHNLLMGSSLSSALKDKQRVLTNTSSIQGQRCEAGMTVNVEAAKQVFSTVKATLSETLLAAIPGSKAAYLSKVQKDCHMELEHDKDTGTYTVNVEDGEMLLDVQERLGLLFGTSDGPKRKSHCLQAHAETSTDDIESHIKQSIHRCDKGVLCDLLKPQFSRSGREVKPKNLDLPEDYTVIEPDRRKSTNKSRLIKKKRPGRPPKNKESAIKNEMTKVEAEVLAHHEADAILNLDKVDLIEQAMGGVLKDLIQENVEDKEGAKIGMETEDGKENNTGIEEVDDEETQDLNDEDDSSYSPIKDEGGQLRNVILGRKKHKKDYEKLAPFKYFCSKCSFKTKRESHFFRHCKLHEKNLPLLKCDMCSFVTIRLGHLRRHELSHRSEVYKCPQCSYTTDSVKLLTRHHKMKHGKMGKPCGLSKLYECGKCDYKTLKVYQYQRHLRCHATVSEDTGDVLGSDYRCRQCPYKTTKKEHFARHISNVHSDRRPYLCDMCGKSFKRTDTLRQHKIVHQDKSHRFYPYQCMHCDKQFRSPAHLREHVTKHTNVRQYLCEICGSAFKTRSVQRKHVQTIHKNPRAHSCHQCEKRFNTKYALSRHLKTHDTPGMRTIQEQSSLILSQSPPAVVLSQNAQVIQDLQDGQVMQPITVVSMVGDTQQISTETIQATSAIEEQYDQAAPSAEVKQLPQGFLQAQDATTTTTLLYLTNMPAL